MQVKVIGSGSVTVIVVEGRVDSSTASDMGQALKGAVDGGATQLVVDLEEVEYITSAGLRELVATFKRVREVDGDLRLASPAERVREVLALSGLDSILAVYDTRRDAVSSF